jgi:hypothetical protein
VGHAFSVSTILAIFLLKFSFPTVRKRLRRVSIGITSTPSQPPNTNQIASANGLNNSNVVVGYYFDSTANTDRGFILKNGAYTVFDVSAPGAYFTALYGINDFKDVSGAYGSVTPGPHYQAFRQIGNKQTDLNVNASVGTAATGTNNLRQTVGFFSQSDPFVVEATAGAMGLSAKRPVIRRRSMPLARYQP